MDYDEHLESLESDFNIARAEEEAERSELTNDE